MKKIIVSSVVFLGVGLLPQVASAQMYPSYPQIVVIPQTPSGSAIPNSDTIIVNAQGASLSGTPSSASSVSFTGTFSNSPTVVTALPGAYSVAASPLSGWFFSYSPACSGTLVTGTAVCTITASPNTPSAGSGILTVYTNVNFYQEPLGGYGAYPPQNFTISVSGNSPMPGAFQGSASGIAVSLAPGYFEVIPSTVPGWSASRENNCSGVIQGGQSLSCTVTYSYAYGGYAYPTSTYPTYPSYPSYPTYSQPPAPVYTQTPPVRTVYPALPNTGYAPQNGSTIAFALVAMLGLMVFILPYVRKMLRPFVG